jgi:hypothetical protein
MPVLGLGGSVGTDSKGVEAEVIVVDDVDHLTRLDTGTVAGKIVLFNTKWNGYDAPYASQVHGPAEAERYGNI